MEMQPGYYGQNFPMMGGMPTMGMPYAGMPYGSMPYGGMPYGGMPYGGMPYGGMPYGGMGTTTAPYGTFQCPSCGYSGPMWNTGTSPTFDWTGTYGNYPMYSGFGGLGGLRHHGGSYSPQFTATGLPTDEEIVEMIYDAMDVEPFIPYDADIDVSCDAGVVVLTGTVTNKRAKHAAGDVSWWVPGVTDVRNDIKIAGRRRARTAPKETEGRNI